MKTSPQKEAKKRLTYAGKRYNMTLESVIIIMIKIPNGEGGVIECSNTEEAIEVLKFLSAEKDRRNAEQRKREHIVIRRTPGLASVIAASSDFAAQMADQVEVSAWSKDSFWKFIEALGEQQTRVLSLLVRKQKASDEEIRKLLKVDGNQALAGVLSGISKQAANLGISARSVYTVEDERKSGELSKTYVVSKDFAFVASQMNWPED
jgi:arginine repressor